MVRRHQAQAPVGTSLSGDEALALLRLAEGAPAPPPAITELLLQSVTWRDDRQDDGLDAVRRAASLDTREVDLLLVAAAVAVDPHCARVSASLQGQPVGAGLSVGLAGELLGLDEDPDALLELISLEARLLRAGLVDLAPAAPGTPWALRPLAPGAGVLALLARPPGVAQDPPPPVHARVRAPAGVGRTHGLALAGPVGLPLQIGDGLLPALADARTRGRVPVLEVPAALDARACAAAEAALAAWPGPLVLVEVPGGATLAAPSVPEAVEPASGQGQGREEAWQRAVQARGWPEEVASASASRWPLLPPATVHQVAARARAPHELPRAVRGLSAELFRGLADVRPSSRTWDDLVLAPALEARLRELTSLPAHRDAARQRWGLPDQGPTGLKLLLAGPPGTGKTLAAEVLAGALGLDLVRVDLAAVVSRWVGETSKHLRDLFAAAAAGTALLLFDEGDALFGRRGAEAEGQERYANQEVADLLQRLEDHRGAAVVTTNLRSAIDPAFLRRFTDVLELGAPAPAERARLWRRALPMTCAPEVDVALLARWVRLPPAGIAAAGSEASALACAAGREPSLRDVAEAAAVQLRKAREPISEVTLGPLRAELARSEGRSAARPACSPPAPASSPAQGPPRPAPAPG